MIEESFNTNYELLLQLANDRLSLAVDAIGVGFWDWKIDINEVYYDKQWCNLLGYAPEEVQKNKSFWEDRIHPDDKHYVMNALKKHFDGKESIYKTEHRVLTKSGSYIWVLDIGKIIERSGLKKPIRIIGITINISEKVISNQKINQSEEKYQSIFEHLNDAFCRFTFSGQILEVNKNLCQLLGIKETELINSNIKHFFNNTTIKYLYRRLSKIIDQKSTTFETEIVVSKRKILPINISARLITISGDGVIQALIHDISELKAYEKALLDEKLKFKALLEHSPNIICRFGRNLKCQYVSPNILKTVGVNPDKLEGLRLIDTKLPNSLAIFLEEKMRWVFRKSKESTVDFSFESQLGLKYFDAIIVPEVNISGGIETILVTVSDITEKKQKDRELNISKQKLEEAEKTVHFGTYEFDLKTNKLTWSKETYLIFEQDPIIEPPSIEEYFSSFVHPDDSENAYKIFSDCIKSGNNFTQHYRISTSNGVTKYINDVAKIETDFLLGKVSKMHGTIIDNSEKRQIENTMFAEKDILQVIMDNVPDAIYFKDSHEYYVKCNRAMAAMFGSDDSEFLIGKTAYDLFPNEIAKEIHDEELNIFITGIPVINSEKKLTTPNGTKWLSSTVVGVKDYLGNVIQLVGITSDINHHKASEVQLRSAKEKAEKSDKLKSAFLANMSHEIRTPINGILGFANLMEIREFSRDKQIQYLKIINNSGKLLLNLINDIIDIAKIEAGQLNIENVNVDLNALIYEISEFYQGEKIKKDKKHIEIIPKFPMGDYPQTIISDSYRLRQIINNLISNALKFSDSEAIEFGFEFQIGSILFFVKDKGIGMSKVEQDLIFERFKQVGSSSKKKEGTGLGLAISKGLIELMGGNIWVKSQSGKGSEFRFTLPLKLSLDQSTVQQNKGIEIDTSNLNWNGKTILLVEDEDINFMYISELIENTGIILLRTSTAEEAINICKTNQTIDLILMDMRLPGINGFDATKIIKQIRKRTPIIAQTAYAMENERKDCLTAGCDDYLTKPFDQKVLFDVIDRYLSQENN